MVKQYQSINNYCELCYKYNITNKYNIIKRKILKHDIINEYKSISDWNLHILCVAMYNYIYATNKKRKYTKDTTIVEFRDGYIFIKVVILDMNMSIDYSLSTGVFNISYNGFSFTVYKDKLMIDRKNLQHVLDIAMRHVHDALMMSLTLLGGYHE